MLLATTSFLITYLITFTIQSFSAYVVYKTCTTCSGRVVYISQCLYVVHHNHTSTTDTVALIVDGNVNLLTILCTNSELLGQCCLPYYSLSVLSSVIFVIWSKMNIKIKHRRYRLRCKRI